VRFQENSYRARITEEVNDVPDLIPKVNHQALYRMEIARRGTCQDCRRWGRDHKIIFGHRWLICSSCGQNHDCTNWEEINDDPKHQILRNALPYAPSSFPTELAGPSPESLRPPPPLKDRPYAGIAAPSHGADKEYENTRASHRHEMREPVTYANADDGDSEDSPVSPIAVTKALPLSSATTVQRGVDNVFLGAQASEEEMDKASKDIKRVAYLRFLAEEDGLRGPEGGPLLATYAAYELSKTSDTTIAVRPGNVKTGQGHFHRTWTYLYNRDLLR
jgi:hypothetical protein